MKKFRSIFLALICALFIGCAESQNERIILNTWKYHNGTEFTNSGDFFYRRLKIQQLHKIASLMHDTKGFAYLSTSFKIPNELKYMDLSLFLGKTSIAAKVFVNTHELQNIGIMPPNAFYNGSRSYAINIPHEYLNPDGLNSVDIILWVEGTGGIEGIPFVSLEEDVNRHAKITSFFMSELPLMLAAALLLITIYYFMMFSVQTKRLDYLFFGLMNFCSMFFIFPFYAGEFPWLLGFVDMLSFVKLFEAIAGVTTAYFTTSFFRASLQIPYNPKTTIARLGIYSVIVVSYLSIEDLAVYYKSLPIIYGGIGIQIIFLAIPIFKYWNKKRNEIIHLIWPFIPTVIAISLDIIFKVRTPEAYLPFFTSFGWVLTSIMYLAVLSHRYAIMQREVDLLNSHLEQEVEKRTKELEIANQELAFKSHQSERDMELAVHMQREFYKKSQDFFGWDVAVHFQPLSGISGDLYDFYAIEGILRGAGLFDVSGHGISSGLVTMLAKNAIFHEFRTSLPLDLSSAIEKVNDAIIRVKGEIENYMTGILCRFDKNNNSKVELVNAGCPYPIVKHVKTGMVEVLKPDATKPQYGMLGVKGFDLKCQTINFEIEEEDFLVMYTDGLNESTNRDGVDYGHERVLESIKRADGTAQDILESITNDFLLFLDGAQMDDDLTIMVLKRTKKYEEDIGDLEEL